MAKFTSGIKELPKDFVLEKPPSQGLSELPEGFVLEKPMFKTSGARQVMPFPEDVIPPTGIPEIADPQGLSKPERFGKKFINELILSDIEKGRPSSAIARGLPALERTFKGFEKAGIPPSEEMTFLDYINPVHYGKAAWEMLKGFYAPKSRREQEQAHQALKQYRGAWEFSVPVAETTGEKITDVAAGLGAFVTRIIAAKKVLPSSLVEYPNIQSALAFELVNTQDLPGTGAAMSGVLRVIGQIPATTLPGKAGRLGVTMGAFGGITAARGGSPEDIAIASMIPFAMAAIGATQNKISDVRLVTNLRSKFPFMREVSWRNSVKFTKGIREAYQIKKGKLSPEQWSKRVDQWSKKHAGNMDDFFRESLTNLRRTTAGPEKKVMETYGRELAKIRAEGGPQALTKFKKTIADANKELARMAIKPPIVVEKPPSKPVRARITFKEGVSGVRKLPEVTAVKDGVGVSRITYFENETGLTLQKVDTPKEFQREGYATKVAEEIVKRTGKKFTETEAISEEGEAFVQSLKKKGLFVTKPEAVEVAKVLDKTISRHHGNIRSFLKDVKGDFTTPNRITYREMADVIAKDKGLTVDIKETPIDPSKPLGEATKSYIVKMDGKELRPIPKEVYDVVLVQPEAVERKAEGAPKWLTDIEKEIAEAKVSLKTTEHKDFTELESIEAIPTGEGAGTAALQELIDKAEKPIRLTVAKRNERAIALYKRLGFKEITPEDPRITGVRMEYTPVAKIEPTKVEKKPKGGLIQQAIDDWNTGRLYIDNNGNWHLRPEGQTTGKGPIAPYNKEIKSHVSAKTLHLMATSQKKAEIIANLVEKAKTYKTADSFAKRIKLTTEEVRALKDAGYVRTEARGELPDLRWFWQEKLKAEPTKVVGKKFVREAREEKIITEAEMGIVEMEPGTGVPYWHKAATQGQKDRIMELAQKKAMVSDKGKLKPQFRKIAGIYTGEKYIDNLTEEQADTLISVLLKLLEPKMKDGKLVPPSIPSTTALATKGFFQRKFKRPTPFGLITSNTFYAEKLGVKSLVEPLEKAKMRFDLEHRSAANELDKMGKTIDRIGKTTAREWLAAKRKNIPTKARMEMGNLLDSYDEPPANLDPEKKEIFNWFRNLTKTMLARQNEAREKLGWPLIKNRKAYMRHIATDVSRDMLAGKYPFPEGIGFWSGLNVGKKVFNPMEFQRRLEDDVHGLFSTDPVYASKAMMHNALKEIHLNQPLKFFNEQLNALGKDLPEYKNLSPRERAELDRTMVMPADTRRWLIDYVNTVIKGRQSYPDKLVNNIVNESGLKGLLNKILRPFGKVLSHRPVTRFFQGAGRVQMAGVMGPRPRLLIRNKFQLTQNLALYGMKANVRAFLPPNKELKGLLDESLFLKSYTGLEELPADLAKKVEKLWHKTYQWTATSNARQSMEVAYWDIKELIDNPKYKKYGWKPEHLLKEMEFGASATQYQYNAIGMPGIFRHKSLIPATRLTSWWMNYFAKFHREALHRAFAGRPSWSGPEGPTLPWSRRLGWLRYAVLGGLILNTMGYTRSYMFGAAPTGWPPALQAVDGLYKYVIADDEKRRKAAKAKFFQAAKTFIPGYIAYKDFDAIWTGRKDWKSLFFYEKRKKKKSDEPFAQE